MSKRFSLMILGALAGLFAANTWAGEIPKANWKPGYYQLPSIVRFSSDGRFLTMIGQRQTVVLDCKLRVCPLVIDYMLQAGPRPEFQLPPRYTAVSESGNELVTVDTAGLVSWYHVGESEPWIEQHIGRELDQTIYMLSDTSFMAVLDDTAFFMTPGTQRRIEGRRAPHWRYLMTNPLQDSIVILTLDTLTAIVHATSGDTLGRILGKILGLGPDNTLIVHHGGDIDAYDTQTWTFIRTLYTDVYVAGTDNSHYIPTVMRRRFLNIAQGVLDLSNQALLQSPGQMHDVLHDKTCVQLAYSNTQIRIWHEDSLADSIDILDGPIVCIVQHPRDSVIVGATAGAFNPISYGPVGHMVALKDSAIAIFTKTHSFVNTLRPFRRINDTLVTEFIGGTYDRFYGYMNFESWDRSRNYTRALQHISNHSATEEKSFFCFSERGDTLSTRNDSLRVGACTQRALKSLSAFTTSFVPGTEDYVAANVKFNVNNCTIADTLPYTVLSISPLQDRVAARVGDTVFTSSTSSPQQRFASVISLFGPSGWWSDSGFTYRFSENRKNIVSLYANGRIERISLPALFTTNRAQWSISNDGRVLTSRFADTIVSIDMRTQTILREYNGAPWLKEKSFEWRIRCNVANIDGSLVVSLPGGCVSVFPGVEVPTTSTVNHQQRSSPTKSDGVIKGATPHSPVSVYTVNGNLIGTYPANDLGYWTATSLDLTLGAYILVWESEQGFQSNLVLWTNE